MGSVARVFWGPRPQSVESGVAGLVASLVALRGQDPDHYGAWFRKGRSRAAALRHPIAPTVSAVFGATGLVRNPFVVGLPPDADGREAQCVLDILARVWQPDERSVWRPEDAG